MQIRNNNDNCWYCKHRMIRKLSTNQIKGKHPPKQRIYIYINGSIDINHPFLDTYDTLTCQTMCIYIFNTESLKSI